MGEKIISSENNDEQYSKGHDDGFVQGRDDRSREILDIFLARYDGLIKDKQSLIGDLITEIATLESEREWAASVIEI